MCSCKMEPLKNTALCKFFRLATNTRVTLIMGIRLFLFLAPMLALVFLNKLPGQNQSPVGEMSNWLYLIGLQEQGRVCKLLMARKELCFNSKMVSLTNTQLSHCHTKAITDNTEMNVPIGWNWHTGSVCQLSLKLISKIKTHWHC